MSIWLNLIILIGLILLVILEVLTFVSWREVKDEFGIIADILYIIHWGPAIAAFMVFIAYIIDPSIIGSIILAAKLIPGLWIIIGLAYAVPAVLLGVVSQAIDIVKDLVTKKISYAETSK